MKQRRIPIAAFSLAFAFVMLLTGCGGAGPDAGPTTAAQTTEAATTQQLDPYEVVWLCGTGTGPQKDTPEIEAEASKFLTEKINATLKILFFDWGSYAQKRDLMLAANEKVDVCFTAGWCGYAGGLGKGQYLNIKDLIDQYAPKTKALICPTLWLGPVYKGGIYGIPANKEAGQTWGFMYRKDITDKHGIDVLAAVKPDPDPVKMLDEFEPILYQIHQLEPNLTTAQSAGTGVFYYDGKWEGISGDFDYLGVKVDGDKFTAISTTEQPETMQGWQRTRKWYVDGLIQKDVLVDQEHNNTAQQQGTVFSAVFNLKPYKDAETNAGAANGIVWQQIDMTPPRANIDAVSGSLMAVPSYCKDPARAVMFLEQLNTDEYLNNLINFGIEGKHYKKTGDKRIDFADGVTAQTSGYFPNTQWAFGNQFINYLWPAEKDDKWAKFDEFNNACIPSKIIDFVFDTEPVKTQVAAIANVKKQYSNQLGYGAVDPAAVGPQYITKLKQAGLQDVLAELQKQLDAWAASK